MDQRDDHQPDQACDQEPDAEEHDRLDHRKDTSTPASRLPFPGNRDMPVSPWLSHVSPGMPALGTMARPEDRFQTAGRLT
jgi:hypothetical protein